MTRTGHDDDHPVEPTPAAVHHWGQPSRAGTVEDPDRVADDMILVLIPVALTAIVIGLSFGWKWVLAPLLGFAIYRWCTGMLRAMVHDGQARVGADEQQPRPVARDERVLYWCEECGTEVVLLVRGSGKAPRHCGSAMHERAELLSN